MSSQTSGKMIREFGSGSAALVGGGFGTVGGAAGDGSVVDVDPTVETEGAAAEESTATGLAAGVPTACGNASSPVENELVVIRS